MGTRAGAPVLTRRPCSISETASDPAWLIADREATTCPGNTLQPWLSGRYLSRGARSPVLLDPWAGFLVLVV
jgi:hypothetical protein